MSEWQRAEWADWIDKMMYIERITGEDLVEKYC